MGRLPTGNRKYNLQDMQNVHHEVARMLLLGLRHVDIANRLGVTPTMVSYTANSPIVKRQLVIMRGARDAHSVDCAARIKELAPRAIEVLGNLMDSENENTSIKASIAILDRAGHAPVQRVQAEHAHMHFTSDELADIKRRARDVIDVQTLPDTYSYNVGGVEGQEVIG